MPQPSPIKPMYQKGKSHVWVIFSDSKHFQAEYELELLEQVEKRFLSDSEIKVGSLHPPLPLHLCIALPSPNLINFNDPPSLLELFQNFIRFG